MRKLILALLLLALSVPASAEDRLAWGGSMMVVGGGGSAAGGSVLKDSNTAASSAAYPVGKYAANLWQGGNFTTGSAYTLTSLKVFLRRDTVATGTLVAHIYATASGAPTGAAVATSGTVNRATIPASETAIEFTGFSYSLNAATEYCIILQSSEVNGDETIYLWHSAGGETYAHETYYDADGVPPFAANNDEDLKFETYGY